MNLINNNQTILGRYTLKDIKEKDYFTIKCPLSDIEINNLKYLKNNVTINLQFTNVLVTDEANYLLNIIEIFKVLSNIPYNYNITININNRELLRQSKLISKLPKNISLSINADEYQYTLNEYKKEEDKLEKLIAPIRNTDLSPLEKYLAVYDIVKNFKPYNKSTEGRKKDRELRYILDDNNPYIVCSGFAKLLNELCTRLGIPSKYVNVSYDITDKKTPIPIEVEYIRHARNIIKLDDNKYNIHGYYVADSTWDNHPQWNLYTNSILTFDRKKEARHLETLEDEDLLLDFHNLDEFTDKMRYFIKKNISYPKIDIKTEEQMRIKTYKDLYKKIMDILFALDRPQYKELYEKYNEYFIFNPDEITSNKLDMVVTNFLTDYAKYIIPLSNNKIEIKQILMALINIKQKVNNWDNIKIKTWLDKTISDNLEAEEEAFPYQYNPNNNTEAYLDVRDFNKQNKRN